jgi:hypothetical protein
MSMLNASKLISLHIWLLRAVAVAQDEDDAEKLHWNGQYNVPLDWERDCRMYGQLGNGNLIPWHRVSQECLDNFKH